MCTLSLCLCPYRCLHTNQSLSVSLSLMLTLASFRRGCSLVAPTQQHSGGHSSPPVHRLQLAVSQEDDLARASQPASERASERQNCTANSASLCANKAKQSKHTAKLLLVAISISSIGIVCSQKRCSNKWSGSWMNLFTTRAGAHEKRWQCVKRNSTLNGGFGAGAGGSWSQHKSV